MARLHLFTGVNRHLEPGQDCTFGRADCCGKEVAAVSRRAGFLRETGRRGPNYGASSAVLLMAQQAACPLRSSARAALIAAQVLFCCCARAPSRWKDVPSALGWCRQQFRLECRPAAEGRGVQVQVTSLSAVNPTKVVPRPGAAAVLLEAGAHGPGAARTARMLQAHCSEGAAMLPRRASAGRSGTGLHR